MPFLGLFHRMYGLAVILIICQILMKCPQLMKGTFEVLVGKFLWPS